MNSDIDLLDENFDGNIQAFKHSEKEVKLITASAYPKRGYFITFSISPERKDFFEVLFQKIQHKTSDLSTGETLFSLSGRARIIKGLTLLRDNDLIASDFYSTIVNNFPQFCGGTVSLASSDKNLHDSAKVHANLLYELKNCLGTEAEIHAAMHH